MQIDRSKLGSRLLIGLVVCLGSIGCSSKGTPATNGTGDVQERGPVLSAHSAQVGVG